MPNVHFQGYGLTKNFYVDDIKIPNEVLESLRKK